MKILVVGGTGPIGGHAAIHLKSLGHDVTIAARNAPHPDTEMAQMPFLQGSYIDGDFTKEQLADFEGLVFAAGNDIRHIPEGVDEVEYWERANIKGIPAFLKLAQEAGGIRRVVYVGSFYSQAAPQAIETSAYVRGRHLSDQKIREMSSPDFNICSVNAPFVVGSVPGLPNGMFEAYTAFAQGKLGIPASAPPGGTNFISTLSLAEAIAGGLERGESGKAYLVGDENLTFQEYFQRFFRAAGSADQVVVLQGDEELPLLPTSTIPTGRGSVISYEPDAAETALLGYRRNDVTRAIEEIVKQYG